MTEIGKKREAFHNPNYDQMEYYMKIIYQMLKEFDNDLPCTVDIESTNSLQFDRETLIYNTNCSSDLLRKDTALHYALFIPDQDFCSLMCSFLMETISKGHLEGLFSVVLALP